MIHEFRDENRWLSNFAECEIVVKGLTYPSVENAYMSMKSTDNDWKELCTKITPGQAKTKSKNIVIRDNWDDIKIMVMSFCLTQKFNQEPFKSKLIATGNQNIQEGNRWGDKFWGVDLKESPNVGENHLGRLIMNIRNGFENN